MSPTYEVRVEGHLDPRWSQRLAGLAIRHQADGTTTLSGPVADQAQLHGVLAGLRDLAVPLLSVDVPRATPPPVPDALAEVTWPRTTVRLRIRRAAAEDADATFAYRGREAVARWLAEAPTDADNHRSTFADPDRLATTLVIESGSRVIGDLALRVRNATQRGHGQAEIGWVLDPAHHGSGYGDEAVRELLHVCFDDLGLHRVVASCPARDEAAWRLMERTGLRRELHARAEVLHRSGEWLDTYGYALTAPEWPGIRPPTSDGGPADATE
jgi:RimJ/RimL family protein N-acetyltransferase